MLWQARWVAQVLSGRVSLPSREAMEADTRAFYDLMARTGTPVRYTHCQASLPVSGLCCVGRQIW